MKQPTSECRNWLLRTARVGRRYLMIRDIYRTPSRSLVREPQNSRNTSYFIYAVLRGLQSNTTVCKVGFRSILRWIMLLTFLLRVHLMINQDLFVNCSKPKGLHLGKSSRLSGSTWDEVFWLPSQKAEEQRAALEKWKADMTGQLTSINSQIVPVTTRCWSGGWSYNPEYFFQ